MNELALNNHAFTELNEHEAMESNGGGFWVPAIVGGVIAIGVNEGVRRTTGKSVVQHAGDGLSYLGGQISKAGKALFN